jgi:hypothetical protein
MHPDLWPAQDLRARGTGALAPGPPQTEIECTFYCDIFSKIARRYSVRLVTTIKEFSQHRATFYCPALTTILEVRTQGRNARGASRCSTQHAGRSVTYPMIYCYLPRLSGGINGPIVAARTIWPKCVNVSVRTGEHDSAAGTNALPSAAHGVTSL